MFTFSPVYWVDLTIVQGQDLNLPIWNMRDGIGRVIDLSHANGTFLFTNSPMQFQNATPVFYSLGVTTDLNGTIKLVANNTQTANLIAGNYQYNVMLTDTTDSTVALAVSGVLQISPGIGSSYPPVVSDLESNTTPIINE